MSASQAMYSVCRPAVPHPLAPARPRVLVDLCLVFCCSSRGQKDFGWGPSPCVANCQCRSGLPACCLGPAPACLADLQHLTPMPSSIFISLPTASNLCRLGPFKCGYCSSAKCSKRSILGILTRQGWCARVVNSRFFLPLSHSWVINALLCTSDAKAKWLINPSRYLHSVLL